MLLAIRERVMGVVGKVILALLFITFAFFGLNSYLTSTAVDYVAKVNDEKIAPARVKSAYDVLVARLRQTLGDRFSSEFTDEALLRKTALDKVVNDVLIMQAASELGFTASDRLVAARVNSVEEFRRDGVFSKDRYQQVLKYQGMTPGQFEYRLKGDIMSSQFRSGIQLTAAVPEPGLRKAYALQGQLRRFRYMVIPAASVAGEVQVTDEAVETYYREHQEEFTTPERVRIQYVELDAATLPVAAEPGEDELRALYQEQLASFTVPEQRHARHILIGIDGTDDAALETAGERAAEVIRRLDAGDSFEALAKEFSDDPGSREAGGDLGFFGREVMAPEFEQAVFAMQPGERSEAVRSPFGLHIIELLEIEPAVVTPFEDVRNQLAKDLMQEQRNEKFYDLSDRLANMAFEQPDTLQGIADELELEIHESDWLSRSGGTGLAAHPEIMEAAFSEDVLANHNNSEVISLGTEHAAVIRVLEHQMAAVQELDTVREQAKAAALAAAVRDRLERKGAELLAQLESGAGTLDAAAGAASLKVEQTGMLKRTASDVPRELVVKAFTLAYPVAGKPVYSGLLTGDGNYVVMELQSVERGSLDLLPESTRKQAWRNLNEIQGSNELQMVAERLRSDATIVIADEND